MEQLFNEAYEQIDDFADKLGEIIYDKMFDENPTTEIGKYVFLTLKECKTDRDFKIANDMLSAICGWNLDSLIEMIRERDEEDYAWESI